ncbi:hypothetical protein Tco_1362036 [Tanacetum coccineum]
MAQHLFHHSTYLNTNQFGRCNNYTVLQSIPCSPECKIVGLILLDHCLSHALTTTDDVPAVDTLHLPVETPENLFVAPANIHTIEAFMNIVGYQGVIDKVSAFFMKNMAQPWQTMFKKKEAIYYPRFIKLIIADLMKKYLNIPKRLEEDYHSIKDDVPLIRETNDFKEYETVFIKVDVPMNQPQPVVSTQGTHRITPSAHRSPTVFASPPETKKRHQIEGKSSSPRNSLKITIKRNQLVEKDDDDSEDMIEPESHKDNPEVVFDDDDNEREKKDDEMGRINGYCSKSQLSLHIQTNFNSQEKNSIKIRPRSSRIASQDVQASSYMIQRHERKCVSTAKFWETHNKIDDILHEVVPQIADNVTNDLIEANLKPSHAPAIIEELFKNHVQFNVIHVHPTTTTSTETESSTNLRYQLYLKMKRNLQDRADDIALWEALRRKFEKYSTSNTSCRKDDFHSHHDEHQDDDAHPEGEKRVKRSKKSKRSKSARDEVIPEDVTPELIAESQNIDKHVPTIFDHARIEATLRDSLKEFPKPDLEEKLNRWVRKEFKTFNEDARLSIQHWKDSWHKRVYKQNQKKVRKNPEDYYSNHMITEVVRIVTNQPHGLDFMEQIIMMRANDKPDNFSEADFKYLNKNDIEDLYYLCRSKEIDNRKVKLIYSLITFIRSCVIWKRVHDF